MLIENEASAVNKAMTALQSTVTEKERGDKFQAARKPRLAITPGALSAQDMIEVLRADGDPSGGASPETKDGTGSNDGGTSRKYDPGSKDNAKEGSVSSWSKLATPSGSNAGNANDNDDMASLVKAAVAAEAEELAMAVREKNEEISVMRAREAELVETLEGVLRKYHSLERAMRLNHDNQKRRAGMRF